MPNPPTWLNELQQLIDGLTYPSESDEPFDAFVWPATQADAMAELKQRGVDGSVQNETSVDEFFDDLRGSENFVRFETLSQFLRMHLSSIRVLRIGEVEVDVYVVGETADGQWAGVHTRSVET